MTVASGDLFGMSTYISTGAVHSGVTRAVARSDTRCLVGAGAAACRGSLVLVLLLARLAWLALLMLLIVLTVSPLLQVITRADLDSLLGRNPAMADAFSRFGIAGLQVIHIYILHESCKNHARIISISEAQCFAFSDCIL